jgi:rod shape-determining protein MreD
MVLESSFLSFLPLDFFKPDFGVPLIIYTTLFIGTPAGLLSAFILGLIQEVLSNTPAGSALFTKLSVLLICGFLRNKLYIDSKYSFSYVCSGFVLFESFLFLTLSMFSKGETSNIVNVMLYTVPNMIFTGFIAIFIFAFLGYLDTKYLNRE